MSLLVTSSFLVSHARNHVTAARMRNEELTTVFSIFKTQISREPFELERCSKKQKTQNLMQNPMLVFIFILEQIIRV